MKIRTMSISLALAGCLTLGLAAPPVACAADAPPATLTITFQKLQQARGAIMFVLVNSEAAFADKAPPVAADMLPVSAETASKTFTGLAPGHYAIKAFHDLDGDGKLGANPFGIPTEPFAFSNNAVGAMGPPKWADASFEVKAGANTHAIAID